MVETEVDEMHKPMEGGRRRRRKQTRKSGKSRKSNNALKEWVRFVKKVRAEEKIDSYKKAMSRAKVRADKGEKWRSMKGGEGGMDMDPKEEDIEEKGYMYGGEEGDEAESSSSHADAEIEGGIVLGGRRRRRTRARSRSRSKSRSMRRSRRRSSRRR
jgi:hypothetical protein